MRNKSRYVGRSSATMNQQWKTDNTSRCLRQDAGWETGGGKTWCGDRCVTVTTNNNRSIDIAVLSHVNITFYRHLSYDIKDSSIILGEKLRYKQRSLWQSDHLWDIKQTYHSLRHHRVLAKLISSSNHYFSLHKTFGFRKKKGEFSISAAYLWDVGIDSLPMTDYPRTSHFPVESRIKIWDWIWNVCLPFHDFQSFFRSTLYSLTYTVDLLFIQRCCQ